MAKKCLVLFILIVASSAVCMLSAETNYFNQYGAMRKWEDTGNWSLGRVPNDTDIAYIFREYGFQDSNSSCLIDSNTGTATAHTLRIGAGQGKAVLNMTDGNLDVASIMQVAYTTNDPNCEFNMSGGTAVVDFQLWVPMNAPAGHVNLSGDAELYLDGALLIMDPAVNPGKEGHIDISDQAKFIVRYGEGTNNTDPPYYLSARVASGLISGNGIDGHVDVFHDEANQQFVLTALPCPEADIAGDDCIVDIKDFAFMASQWLQSGN